MSAYPEIDEVCPQMFADIQHFQSLFSHWPAQDVWTAKTDGDMDSFHYNMGTDAAGNPLPDLHVHVNHIQDAHWNYGQNFGGPLKDTWASGADTVHTGGVGAFGDSYIMDSAYSYAYGGDAESFGNPGVTMCRDSGCSRDHNGYSNIWDAHAKAFEKYSAKHLS